MQEIKCPKCGEVFQVDGSGYAAILKQVHDKEFEKEIQRREAEFKLSYIPAGTCCCEKSEYRCD